MRRNSNQTEQLPSWFNQPHHFYSTQRTLNTTQAGQPIVLQPWLTLDKNSAWCRPTLSSGPTVSPALCFPHAAIWRTSFPPPSFTLLLVPQGTESAWWAKRWHERTNHVPLPHMRRAEGGKSLRMNSEQLEGVHLACVRFGGQELLRGCNSEAENI